MEDSLEHIGPHTVWEDSFVIMIQNGCNHIYIEIQNWIFLLVAIKPKDVNKPKSGNGRILLQNIKFDIAQ